jgi:hypothetical protein
MSSEIMQEVLKMIEAEAQSRPSAFQYELAYQARVAIERIRFAIQQAEQFCPQSNPLHEAGMQLLDALQRLETVERRFQQRSRVTPAPQRTTLETPNGNGRRKEVLS